MKDTLGSPTLPVAHDTPRDAATRHAIDRHLTLYEDTADEDSIETAGETTDRMA
jgi:hypothetical protein